MASAALVALALLFSGAAHAHPLAPSLLELRELPAGEVAVTWKTPLARRSGAPLQPMLPPACTGDHEPAFTTEGSGLVARWRVRCAGGLVGRSVSVAGLGPSRTDALVRVVLADGRSLRAVLSERAPSYTVPERESPGDVAGGYLELGALHILSGLDHLAFVVGLLLLVRDLRSLLVVVTAFTVGHSVTLSLAALGFVGIPVRPVEVAIAASLVALGVVLVRAERHELRTRTPWLFAAGFGLLHGLGFAGALAEVGLPAEAIPLALVSFNVGIELGQLAFVAVALAIGLACRPLLASAPGWTRHAPAYAIGALGSFWMFDRLLFALG